MTLATVYRLIQQQEAGLLAEWIRSQRAAKRSAGGAYADEQETAASAEFLKRFMRGLAAGHADTGDASWDATREFLDGLSRSRAKQGFTPKETATFVFSLKEPLFARMRAAIKDADELGTAIWDATLLLDDLGLYTTEVYQKSREELISRQQQELLELSTPVTRLWEGVLAVPLVGTLDSARTQVVMESLLEEIVRSGASIAVMDITGVPTVDTLVAQHLLKTVAAAKLMGAECVISGIRPQIAQTIVHLGVDLGDVVTKSSLADGFRHALGRLGLAVVPAAGR
ncbi:MAG TPA: STAS domain-containing protein [Gammaproteobacteria bacterium]|nr:STAS domain-containing protein [Gammaproteobacteria bacterium]